MNRLRQLCAVAILTAVLAVPAFAGIMDSPGAPAPAPSQTSTSTSTSMTTVVLTILSLIR
ncbi:MAG TPA: hypothetical protein VN659_02785 [Pyrinomonadaceae bacterium]|nr:hypothetical protein [Pyrinomonadaceae bacterium]